MVANYPVSLRWRVIYLCRDGLAVKEIASRLYVSETFVRKIKRLYRQTSSVEYRRRRGRTRSLDARDVLLIKNVIEHYPEAYEDEVQDWIHHISGKVISRSSIHRYLKKIGYSRRKLNVIAKQRDEMRRAEYRQIIAGFNKDQLLFIDESAKDERTFQRKYARDLAGTGRISVKGNFTRGSRYSVLGALSSYGLEDSQVITGAYDRQQFEFAMLNFIIPNVGSVARGEHCSVIVLDNCNIHYSDQVMNAIRNRGGIVIFLPPYSPDFNPIEDAFNFGKQWLQRNPDICLKYPKRCFEMALAQITTEEATGFFEDCGYF